MFSVCDRFCTESFLLIHLFCTRIGWGFFPEIKLLIVYNVLVLGAGFHRRVLASKCINILAVKKNYEGVWKCWWRAFWKACSSAGTETRTLEPEVSGSGKKPCLIKFCTASVTVASGQWLGESKAVSHCRDRVSVAAAWQVNVTSLHPYCCRHIVRESNWEPALSTFSPDLALGH